MADSKRIIEILQSMRSKAEDIESPGKAKKCREEMLKLKKKLDDELRK